MTTAFKRKAIAWYKIASGSIDAIIGGTALILSAAGLQGLVDRLTSEELREDPNDLLVLLVQHHLPDFLQGKILYASVILAYGVLKIVGGIGFLRGKAWGYFLLIVLVAALFPPDVARFLSRPAWGFGFLLAAHATILYVLLIYRKAFTHV